jgi:asparagine synthase (glutamine-hydrolysing)
MTEDTDTSMRTSGAYGLVMLDGRPCLSADIETLGLSPPGSPAMPFPSTCFGGFDRDAPNAVSFLSNGRGSTLIVGEVEDVEALADQLGIARTASAAALAAAALARFGSDTPLHLLGEWSLIHWQSQKGLTLMMSAARRDRMFYALSLGRVAVAPDILLLGSLPWVGMAPNEAGLLFPLGRAQVRRGQADETMLAHVRQLRPGETIHIHGDGRIEHQRTSIFVPQRRFEGDFEDAMAEAETLLRRIMRAKMQRHRRIMPTCSGGLDSSLLSWLAAVEQGDSEPPVLLTSVAPPSSGLPDESYHSALVARHLGLSQVTVYPPAEADAYRPPDRVFRGGHGPIQSNRHLIVEAFEQAARAAGATLMINGTYGEATITAQLPGMALPSGVRALARRLRARLRPEPIDPEADNPFHCRIAPHRLAALPDAIQSALAQPEQPDWTPTDDGCFGMMPWMDKALDHPGSFYPGAVRMDYPYRDVRLLRLFASFPLAMLASAAHDRPMVRHVLAGRLPDEIRLRKSGRPASPDHLVRLRRQATAARARVPVFRQAGIDDWIDIHWLDGALAQMAAQGTRDHGVANMVQVTAIAAEYMLWLRRQL